MSSEYLMIYNLLEKLVAEIQESNRRLANIQEELGNIKRRI